MKRIIYKPVLGLPFLITVVLLTTQCVDHQAEIPYLTTEVSLVEASASQTSVMLSFNSNVQWKVDFESAWLTSGGIKYGENDGLLEFTLQPNEGVDQRECIVTVSAVSAALEELAQYPFLMREKGSAGREILDACFEVSQLSVRPVLESSSTQAIVSSVAEGLGVAVLPYLLVRKDIAEGTVSQVPLVHPLRRSLNIIYHKSKYLTDNMKAFMELCRNFT